MTAAGEPKFRLKQAVDAVYKGNLSSWAEASTLPAPLREKLEKDAPVLVVAEARVLVSEDGRAHKAALRLVDGCLVEAVLLKPKPTDDWSVCVSTQVGCAMGCTFCATGLMGLRRNLTAEEIQDQVLFWRCYLKNHRLEGRVSNVVYMGMGEPFHNYANVADSLRALIDPERVGLSARHVSVSTVGIVPGIEKFGDDFPTLNLALSLHAANDSLREKIVPANRAYNTGALKDALAAYLLKTKRKVFIEYVLLAGENDRLRDAFALGKFVRACGRPDLLHVNLIAWNPTATKHAAPEQDHPRKFREALEGLGISVTVRRNLGTDIQGACGQLITRLPPPTRRPTTRPAAAPRAGLENRKRPGGGRVRPLS